MVDVLTNILESVAAEVNFLTSDNATASVEFFPRETAAAVTTLKAVVTPREINNSLEARGVIRSEVILDIAFLKKMAAEDEVTGLSRIIETVFSGLAYNRLKGFPDANCVAAERGMFNYDQALTQRVFAASISLTYLFFYKRKREEK